MGCVYVIINTTNSKKYVGKTMGDAENRWKSHIKESRGTYDNLMSKAIRKYGVDAFEIKILEQSNSEVFLFEREKYWIALTNSFGEDGYNLTKGGDGPTGYVFTEIQRKKVSEKGKGRIISPETRKRMSEAQKGKPKAESTRRKYSEWQIGRRLPEETKAKISATFKRKREKFVDNEEITS